MVIELKKHGAWPAAKPWLIAVALIVILIGAFMLFGKGTLEWYYSTQAAGALRDGRLERAAEMYEKQLSLSPRDESLNLRLAALLAEQGFFSRAEYYLLSGIRQASDPFPMYAKLSEIYVAQDKLYDAGELLSNTQESALSQKIESERPAPPALSPPPGVYSEMISVSVSVPDGCVCYISWDGGEIPSISKDEYAAPRKLDVGVTGFRAVIVDSNGLVSEWVTGEYRLEDVVYELSFKDPAVEAHIRAALGRHEGAVMSNEVSGITEIAAGEPAYYTTLADLTFLPALTKLSLSASGGVCDISALPLLTSVTDLSLSGFAIDSVSLESVGQMTWLKGLSLRSNMISDFSSLAALNQLELLDLSTNSVMDISPLAFMPMLREFNAPQNAIDDLTPLSGLTALESLRLADNRVQTLDGISGLRALKILDITNNYITNTTEMGGLTLLAEVRASGNRIEALDNFAALTGLTLLELNSNSISSLTPLSGLTALESLNVSDCAVASLSGLGGCVSLRQLNADNNQISSVDPLRAHPALTELRIESNRLSSLQPLSECPNLKTVYAFGNSFSDGSSALADTGITVYRN